MYIYVIRIPFTTHATPSLSLSICTYVYVYVGGTVYVGTTRATWAPASPAPAVGGTKCKGESPFPLARSCKVNAPKSPKEDQQVTTHDPGRFKTQLVACLHNLADLSLQKFWRPGARAHIYIIGMLRSTAKLIMYIDSSPIGELLHPQMQTN